MFTFSFGNELSTIVISAETDCSLMVPQLKNHLQSASTTGFLREVALLPLHWLSDTESGTDTVQVTLLRTLASSP